MRVSSSQRAALCLALLAATVALVVVAATPPTAERSSGPRAAPFTFVSLCDSYVQPNPGAEYNLTLLGPSLNLIQGAKTLGGSLSDGFATGGAFASIYTFPAQFVGNARVMVTASVDTAEGGSGVGIKRIDFTTSSTNIRLVGDMVLTAPSGAPATTYVLRGTSQKGTLASALLIFDLQVSAGTAPRTITLDWATNGSDKAPLAFSTLDVTSYSPAFVDPVDPFSTFIGRTLWVTAAGTDAGVFPPPVFVFV